MSHRAKGAVGLGKTRKTRGLSPDSRAEARAKREKRLREESPETKRLRQDKARSRYYAVRERDEPSRRGKSGAAWQGLENNSRGDATYAYKSIMIDAQQHKYPMTKTEAAATAKKHPEPSEAVQRARAHHNVKVSRVKKQKKE